jgi:acetyl esterase/lipase
VTRIDLRVRLLGRRVGSRRSPTSTTRLVQVAEHDPLREEGKRYAQRFREAGVPVRLTEYVGMPHGYLNFPRICRAAPQALAEQRAALPA